MAPPRRKHIFRLPSPAPATIYVRRGYNRVLAEEFVALKVKRAELVQDKVEAHSQGDTVDRVLSIFSDSLDAALEARAGGEIA